MTVMINDLSYSDALDQEALQAIAGSGFFSKVWGGIKKGISAGWNYVKNNPQVIVKVIRWGWGKLF